VPVTLRGKKKKPYRSRRLGHATACHSLDGETGEAAQEEGRGRDGRGRSRPQGRIRFGSRVDDARMSCDCGVDKMGVDILFHLKDVVITSATDDVESAISFGGRVDDARMSSGCSVDKMLVDILFHLKDVVTSATDDVESAIIIRFGRVCHFLASEKRKRKMAEKPTFEDGIDGFGHHLVKLSDR